MARKAEQETVLGGDYYDWELILETPVYDKRRCSSCGYEATFPKDMSKCAWKECPKCQKKMRW